MTIQISSLQNQRIKELVKLSKRSVRDRRRATVVEGVREVGLALASGLTPLEVFLCPAVLAPESQALVHDLNRLRVGQDFPVYELTPDIFAKVAYRAQSGGILIVVPYLPIKLGTIPLSPSPFVVVVEGIEKPGNLGAILRTADGAGVDGVLISAGATDIHNPNVIRASLGALFTVPVAEATTAATIAWLQSNGIRIIATSPNAEKRYTDLDMTSPVAIVMGSEAKGLSTQWLSAADDTVYIPMHGTVDSLNLATSTALLLYEVVRQRGT